MTLSRTESSVLPSAAECDAVVEAGPRVPALDRTMLRALAPAVLRVVRQVLGAQDPDVEDLTQESLKALVVAWPHFRGECSPAHFAKRIAVQRCVDAIRRNRAHHKALGKIATNSEALDNSHWLRSRLRQAWQSALGELPVEQAEALTQRYILGCTLEEIARDAAVPLNTVKSRIRLAKQVLRARVAEDPRLLDLLEVP
jgi:RNA polymerase sigma-70 factor (ECF subfamily)